jgi:hypothetical protein
MVMVGLMAMPTYSVPVKFLLESAPVTAWEFAQRDSAGGTTMINVADADGDGMASFVAEFGPLESGNAVHIASGPSRCLYAFVVDETGVIRALDGGTIPFLGSAAGDSLIVEWTGPSSGGFSLGQTVSVTDGVIAGLDGLVHENPGAPTAFDLLAFNVPLLPKFTGEAEVGGLLTVQVIPEPSTVALLLCALAGLGAMGRRK